MEKQQEELLRFLKQNELTTIVNREPFQLRKLPLWGVSDVRDEDINFEWPSMQAIESTGLKRVPELIQITFFFKDSNTVCLRGVQFEHASNLKSPVFDTGDVMRYQIRVDRTVIKATTQVSACCRETQRDSVKSIAFRDQGRVLYEVNHYKREVGVPMMTYELRPGEEIIGGYGVSNQ